jgi:hypothetical protein
LQSLLWAGHVQLHPGNDDEQGVPDNKLKYFSLRNMCRVIAANIKITKLTALEIIANATTTESFLQ